MTSGDELLPNHQLFLLDDTLVIQWYADSGLSTQTIALSLSEARAVMDTLIEMFSPDRVIS